MSNKVSLDKDMLNAIGFLFQNKKNTFLSNIVSDIPEAGISDYIAHLVGDNITGDNYKKFSDWLNGKDQLSVDDEKYFRSMGMINGPNNIVPEAIKKYVEERDAAHKVFMKYLKEKDTK